jgi:hypothetical protein
MYRALVNLEPLNTVGSAPVVALITLPGVGDDERAERRAADHQHFQRLDERAHMAARHDEAADHGAQDEMM